MSRRFKLRKFFGNRKFLDYDPKVFWNLRKGGRSLPNAEWLPDFVSFLEKNNCRSVLEIGCGSGTNLDYAKSRLPFLRCKGIDFSEYHIKLGKERFPSIDFCLGDLVEELPKIESNSFDCVLCAGILMHILPKDISFVVDEIERISSLVFFYEQDKRSEFGLRHPNNFVFFHDYSSLFGGREVFLKKYERDHFGKGIKYESE